MTTHTPRTLDAATLLPGAVVAFDGDPEYGGAFRAAYLAPTRWNGWACPYFTRAEVDRLAARFAQYPEGEQVAWSADDADVLTFAHPDYPADEQHEPDPGVLVDGVRLYAVGAWGWVWSEVSPQALALARRFGAADLPEPDDAERLAGYRLAWEDATGDDATAYALSADDWAVGLSAADAAEAARLTAAGVL